MGQYRYMQKSLTIVIQLLAAGMLLGNAPAQTPAATTTQPGQAATTQAAPAKTTSTAAAKKAPATAKATTTLTLKTQREKASYALGMSIGSGFKRQAIPVDAALVARGLRDAMTGAKPLLTDQEAQASLTQLKAEVNEKMKVQQQAMMEQQKAMQAKAHEAAAGNIKIGEAFLAENKTKEGVVALPSGLQYKILTAGTGPKPDGQRHRVVQLPRHADQREGIRQLLQTRRAAVDCRGRSDPGLDRGVATNAGGIEVAVVHPLESGVRRPGRRGGYWSGRDADF